MKKENPYINNESYVNGTQAADELGVHPITFRKYASRFCIVGVRYSKYTYYRREDIELMRNFFSWGAQDLVQRLETMTGGKVTITMPEK